jgi:hypothetical protein
MDPRTKVLTSIGGGLLVLLLILITIAVTSGGSDEDPAPHGGSRSTVNVPGRQAPTGDGPGPWAELDWTEVNEGATSSNTGRLTTRTGFPRRCGHGNLSRADDRADS